jgi:hypothetical protein
VEGDLNILNSKKEKWERPVFLNRWGHLWDLTSGWVRCEVLKIRTSIDHSYDTKMYMIVRIHFFKERKTLFLLWWDYVFL